MQFDAILDSMRKRRYLPVSPHFALNNGILGSINDDEGKVDFLFGVGITSSVGIGIGVF